MGHQVTFVDSDTFTDVLSEDEVRDLIHLFYRWKDTNFVIIGREERPHRRGSHIFTAGTRTHTIRLSVPTVTFSVLNGSRVGGNGPAPDVRFGLAMVLCHELQHANQAGAHAHDEPFYTHADYETRPCEREAREFVDVNMDQIRAVLGQDVRVFHRTNSVARDTVDDVVSMFDGVGFVSTEDLVKELRSSGLNGPIHYRRAVMLLSSRGTIVR